MKSRVTEWNAVIREWDLELVATSIHSRFVDSGAQRGNRTRRWRRKCSECVGPFANEIQRSRGCSPDALDGIRSGRAHPSLCAELGWNTKTHAAIINNACKCMCSLSIRLLLPDIGIGPPRPICVTHHPWKANRNGKLKTAKQRQKQAT